MPRPVHFEFIAEDPERAAAFWSDVFGWSIDKWEGPAPYWLVRTGEENPGIDGGIARRADFRLPGHTVVTVQVDAVDDTTAAIERAGGEILMEKMAVPHVGWLAYCRDPEGTVFGVLEPDESAS